MSHARLTLMLLAASPVPALLAAPAAADDVSLRAMVANFGKCVVRKHHDAARSYLLSDSNNKNVQSDGELFDRSCFSASFAGNVGVSFTTGMYRDGLATALVQADFATADPVSFADRPPLSHPAIPQWADAAKAIKASNSPNQKARLRYLYDRAAEEADYSRIGECLVRADPAAVRRWIFTPVESAEETSQSKPLAPAFEKCSQQASVVHFFNPEVARGPVALSYYRLANSTPRPASGAAN